MRDCDAKPWPDTLTEDQHGWADFLRLKPFDDCDDHQPEDNPRTHPHLWERWHEDGRLGDIVGRRAGFFTSAGVWHENGINPHRESWARRDRRDRGDLWRYECQRCGEVSHHRFKPNGTAACACGGRLDATRGGVTVEGLAWPDETLTPLDDGCVRCGHAPPRWALPDGRHVCEPCAYAVERGEDAEPCPAEDAGECTWPACGCDVVER